MPGIPRLSWVHVARGGTVEVTDEAVYLAMSLRNPAADVAVLEGWRMERSDDRAARTGHRWTPSGA